jgi:hypothetical protein
MKDRTPVRITLTDVASALPDLVLAGTFALVWLDPTRPGLPSVRRLVMTVLLEFFIVHSSGFMGVIAIGNRSRSKAVWLTLGLGAFYTLFIGAFAIGSSDWWLLGSFWLLMGNRLLGLMIGQAPDDRRDFLIMGTWAFTVAAYLLAVGIGVMANVPALGISASVIDAQGFSVGGLWTEHPQTALAAGAIYFAIVGLWELLIPPIIFRQDREMAAMERESGIVTARTSSPRI